MEDGRRIPLAPILPLLACPACGSALRHERGRLSCNASHSYALTARNIPIFDPPNPNGAARREEAEEEEVAAYAGMRSFAVEAIGRGESEGLYRTVSDMLGREALRSEPRWILDLGCGAGRTLVDAAERFPRGSVIGVDRRLGALTVAYAIARLSGPAMEVDLRRWGLGQRKIGCRGLQNVFLLQANAQRLPFVGAGADGWQGFDIIACVNLLDRVERPDMLLNEIARLLAPGGMLLLTTPLNWREGSADLWEEIGDLEGLKSAIKGRGLAVEQAFDGLMYREIADARGSATDWRVAVIVARGGTG